MTDETDFLDLYARLRLSPDCTLVEFKHAYRQYVGQWHPDRRADAAAEARLQGLTAQYGAAMVFYRRHRRLPGAHVEVRRFVAPVAPMATIDDELPTPSLTMVVDPVGVTTLRTGWLLLIAVVGVVAIGWSSLPAVNEPRESSEPVVAQTARNRATAVPAVAATLALGMSEDQVAAIEGEPTQRGGQQWEYGPSWVRFENDALSDWYSSPLRGLHTPTAHARP